MKVRSKQSLLSLRPTQFSIGMLEIEARVKELKSLGSKALKSRIHKEIIPVIVSPWRDLYAIDHHHFLFSAWQAGIRHVRIKVIKDLSKSRLSYLSFWRRLGSNDHVHLYDQFGEGPRNPLYLPNDVRGLADDPYRSLAWAVRRHKGYKNTNIPFADFLWADYFRKQKLLESEGRGGLKKATRAALLLAHRPAARRLPGYIAKANKAGHA